MARARFTPFGLSPTQIEEHGRLKQAATFIVVAYEDAVSAQRRAEKAQRALERKVQRLERRLQHGRPR